MTISPPPNKLNRWLIEKNWGEIQSYLSKIPKNNFQAQDYLAKGMVLAYGPKNNRNLEQAIFMIEKACLLSPKEASFLNTLSELLLQIEQPLKALQVATRARQINLKAPMLAVSAGRAAWACHNRGLAYKHFQDALHSIPKEKLESELHLQIKLICFKSAPFWWTPLHGKSLSLVRFEDKHKNFLIKTRKNSEFQHHYNLFKEDSVAAIEHEMKLTEHSPVDSKKVEWVIEKDSIPIGIAGLVNLDLKNSRAEIQVGFPNQKYFGSALEACLLILEFSFTTLGLNKVISYVYSDNPNGQRNTLHLGFKQEGLLESHIFDPTTKNYLDLYVNGCLLKRFFSDHYTTKLSTRLLGRTPSLHEKS